MTYVHSLPCTNIVNIKLYVMNVYVFVVYMIMPYGGKLSSTNSDWGMLRRSRCIQIFL